MAAVMVMGCPGEAPKSAQGSRAKPKKSDPKLTLSWSMKAEHSPMSNGDLGSSPEETAKALYEHEMPAVTHRVAKACAESGALKGAASVALRFSVTAEGKVGPVLGDPEGVAGRCVAEGFSGEVSGLSDLPAGDALLRLKFHPAK